MAVSNVLHVFVCGEVITRDQLAQQQRAKGLMNCAEVSGTCTITKPGAARGYSLCFADFCGYTTTALH
jgi:hypothetical protein